MKNKILLAILAVALIFGLVFIGCGGGGGSNPVDPNPQEVAYLGEANDGTMYTLIITEKTARYAAKTGDAYELTAGSKKSTGTVSGKSGDTLTLKPSRAPNDTFTITVDDTGIKGMDRTITWDKSTDGTTTAPSTLTPKGSGSIPTIPTTGKLTITGIPAKYYGKYVSAILSPDINQDMYLSAAAELNFRGDETLGKIDNTGSVTMKVWKHTTANGYSSYTGGDIAILLHVYVKAGGHELIARYSDKSQGYGGGQTKSLTFSSGIGTISVSDLTFTDIP
jgi:hypothetical protein